jgi:hypothetical protein
MINKRIILSSALVLSAWLLAPGCASKDDSSSDSEAVGKAQAAVTNVPNDGTVACITITTTGSWTNKQSFDVTPGQSTVFMLDGIPTGTVEFDGAAYPTACSQVPANAVPTWVSAPVLATVTVGQTTTVNLNLQQAGAGNVGVDFMPAPACRSNGQPCLTAGECCSGTCGGGETPNVCVAPPTNPTNFQVLAQAPVTYQGFNYVALKVALASNTSAGATWCDDYQHLCQAMFGGSPVGCGAPFDPGTAGYQECGSIYGANGVNNTLGCNPAGGVANAAQAAGFTDAAFSNSFGFHYCGASGSNCSNTWCSGQYCNSALSYYDASEPYGYTLCLVP